MKTAEERAEEIENEAFDDWCFDKQTKQYQGAFDRDECAAIIRADREALLKRVVEVIVSAAESHSGGATPTEIGALVGICIAAVRKEAL